MIVARAFEVLQKPQHPLEGEVLDPQLADRPPRLSRHEQEEEPQCVAVAADGRRSQPLLIGEILGEERVHDGPQRWRGHGRTSCVIGAANASKR